MSKPAEPERLPLDVILKKAGKRALGGGVPGAIAMGAQVVTLMPLRTTMNVRSGATAALVSDACLWSALLTQCTNRSCPPSLYLITHFLSRQFLARFPSVPYVPHPICVAHKCNLLR
jgi:hypothetical protein